MDNNTYFGLGSFHVKIAIWNPLYEIVVSVNLFMSMDLSNHIVVVSTLLFWYVCKTCYFDNITVRDFL
jgi:hypothetical protein